MILLVHCHVIAAKLTLAKRLAQCLNPALPSGLHQKALDTFDTVFSKMGVCKFYTVRRGIPPKSEK